MHNSHVLDGVPAPLWRMIGLAAHRLLMLDFDGTLAPFAVRREDACPAEATRALMRRIAAAGHTTLAVVSGRPMHEIERLAGDLPGTLVGEHGWSCRTPEGVRVERPLPPEQAAAIERAERRARESDLGEHLERKRTAVVLHVRGLPTTQAASLAARALALWEPMACAGSLSADVIDGGVEFRAWGRNKGTMALSLLSQSPPGTLGVFVGDDVTDEDAFEVVREWGFGVRVGDPAAPSKALGHLPSCDAVPAFLERWLEVAAPRA